MEKEISTRDGRPKDLNCESNFKIQIQNQKRNLKYVHKNNMKMVFKTLLMSKMFNSSSTCHMSNHKQNHIIKIIHD